MSNPAKKPKEFPKFEVGDKVQKIAYGRRSEDEMAKAPKKLQETVL